MPLVLVVVLVLQVLVGRGSKRDRPPINSLTSMARVTVKQHGRAGGAARQRDGLILTTSSGLVFVLCGTKAQFKGRRTNAPNQFTTPNSGSAMLPNPYAGGPLNTNRSTACHILEPRPTKNFEDEDVAPALSSRVLLKKTLFRRGLAKRVVTVEMRYLPAAEPFRFEHRTMAGVLVVHSGKRFDETCC